MLGALGLFSMTGGVGRQPQNNKILDRTIPEFQVIDVPTSLALQRLAGTSSVPIGMEAAPENTGQSRTIAIRLKGTTVRSVLDLVVQKDPRYVWQSTGSAINVFPKSAKDIFLETIVGRFEVTNVNRDEAIKTLENSIEVRRVLGQTTLRDGTLKSLPGDSEYGLPRFSLDLKDVTVRSILNAIMLKSNSNSWIFFRYGAKKDSFSLLMR
jgi:hypothetical protein